MKLDRTPDLNAGVHLLDTTDEWWANMSVEDCEELMNFIDDLEAEVVPGFIEWGMNRLQFVKENNQMEDVFVNELSNLGLTFIWIVVGGIVIYLLDRYVFNKDRYK